MLHWGTKDDAEELIKNSGTRSVKPILVQLPSPKVKHRSDGVRGCLLPNIFQA